MATVCAGYVTRRAKTVYNVDNLLTMACRNESRSNNKSTCVQGIENAAKDILKRSSDAASTNNIPLAAPSPLWTQMAVNAAPI